MIKETKFYDDGISDSHIVEEYDYEEHLRELEYWLKRVLFIPIITFGLFLFIPFFDFFKFYKKSPNT